MSSSSPAFFDLSKFPPSSAASDDGSVSSLISISPRSSRSLILDQSFFDAEDPCPSPIGLAEPPPQRSLPAIDDALYSAQVNASRRRRSAAYGSNASSSSTAAGNVGGGGSASGGSVSSNYDSDGSGRSGGSRLVKTGEMGTGSERESDGEVVRRYQEKRAAKPKPKKKVVVISGGDKVKRNAGIRMAPLNVPMKRRLQTAAVLLHGFTIPLYTSLFWFLLAIPLTWPILLPYLLYCLFSEAHLDGSAPRRRSPFLRSLPLWRLYTDYFPLKLHATTALDPAKNYIFTYHPHGIISHGAFGHFCTEHTTGFEALFPGITNTLLTLDSNFRVPFYRDFLLLMGLASVSRRSCEALLRGEAAPRPSSPNSTPASSCSLWKPWTWWRLIFHLPIFHPAPHRSQQQYTAPSGGGRAITIIAIRENAGLVPVLSFGENELYEQVVPAGGGVVARLQMFVKRVAGFTVPLFHARGVFNYDVGLLPYRREVNTVVGRPVFPRAQMESPRDGDVEELQERYLAELRRLWEEHKDVYARGRLPGKEGEMVFVG
ncbi:uncharacterized protein LAJ45_10417 [Morchella importuna]|uniref:uncharacterized protein n=1 Tax=Morchella importuna TaxID=1174673 RepID=UPI001E8E4575|nr:uncharacterized protein LAJ45_10417 [Morchella importuna]KAH8145616.1 hypothetical protein LAJ45_10417 [Morchella importuna]